jgi:hypothetical protein
MGRLNSVDDRRSGGTSAVAPAPDDGRATPSGSSGLGELFRISVLVLVGVALTALQLVRTPGYVLDDWFAYRNVWFGGACTASAPAWSTPSRAS